ncbi:hypothetical protein [Candidatus Nitrosacidococcus tergens]|uniref:Uncharacterized protein n=1 Tax=Candidatus Nitrosacidococcus tergens TaxID=553981 RepID=A0A7G1QAY6_9GAMM|nr:hypothetical protein [Candidatus Nitrosacidococcus tergens]CAB1277025.1 conserved protein of unknown function [Candidatus Nitrosacidococcus tergens]
MNKAKKYLLIYLPLLVLFGYEFKSIIIDRGKIILPDGSKVLPAELKTEKVLNSIAAEMNKMLPRVVDQDTKLTLVEAKEGELIYDYDKINKNADEFNANEFIAMMKPKAIDLACHSYDMEAYLSHGINVHYIFYGKDHKLIGGVIVNQLDCSY